MKVHLKPCLVVMLVVAVASLRALAVEEQADVPLRLANGTVVDGTMQEATPEGLVIQGAKGKYTAPWKCLSAGTRYRYEIPMLAAQEIARSNALKKAQAEAVKKAAAAKAAVTKASGTNAAGVASTKPSAKK